MEQVIGIIGAMDSEIALLCERMTAQTVHAAAGLTVYCGRLEDKAVAVVRCGEGKVRAALCAQMLIDRFGVTAIINTGVAGGLAAGLRVGDLVLATDAVQHDFDLTAFGYVRGYVAGMGDGTAPTRYACDAKLCAAFRTAADALLPELGHAYIEGTVATGDVFVDSTPLKRELIAAYGAAAAEMEGGAIAAVAVQNGVPFVVVRAISDLAEGGATVSFETFEVEAARTSAAITCRMLGCL